ncbi:uncharacterized protein MELLADRAFT_86320 [Melampsora larici-populina 98AG31]|uniref:Uncharacterized protein n=1 Tax=Melampsora larici-populina (strain 98AG31 / pathotype 3-4-7) TaxID=747676 RepID=F4RLB5_MELLP|nr:uncharacterized protein MELLADRAFT_86320 [Melampsora larici-populina 98AG31]EGG06900.1 hypothetical protein MELLADRAFT_86320 [Melampsora larici-populina 98AG31]
MVLSQKVPNAFFNVWFYRLLTMKTCLNPLPKECKDFIEQIFTIGLDFLLITLDRSPEDMTPSNSVDNIYIELSRREENAYLEMSQNSFSSSNDSMDIDTESDNLSILGLIQTAPNHDGVDLGALIVSEDVLRAQLRAGLWVRNGFRFRVQGLHYREYSLRETTFNQDIY